MISLSSLRPRFQGPQGATGLTGAAGQSIELQKTSTHIQWKYANEASWTNLVPLTDLTNGVNGKDIELQKGNTHLQWRNVGDPSWIDLVSLQDLVPNAPTGNYDTTIGDSVQSVSVGGASAQAASVWKTKTVIEVLDSILFPDQAPTYTIPTLAISGTSGTKEIGETINQSITLTATKNDAGAFTLLTVLKGGSQASTVSNPTGSNTTNIADQYGYSNPNSPNKTYTLVHAENFSVTSGNTSWSGTSNYSAGSAKNNNKGVEDSRTASVRSANAPQAASTGFTSGSVTVTGIYPYFWGKSSSQPTAGSIATAIAAGSTNKVLSDSTGTISVTFAASAEYVWVAIPSASTEKTKWYNTALNNGSIGAGQFILAPATQSVTSPQGRWSGVSYKIYISSGATATSGAIEFRNS